MSEPVAWRYKMIPPGWTYSDKKPDRDFFGSAWDRIQVTPLYLHPDPRVAELEAVLVEAREALVPYMKYVDGTKILNHPAQVVAKIDEVLK